MNMDVSNHSALKNKLMESLLAGDSVAFKKCLNEAIQLTEKSLIEKYSNEIKERLND